MPGAAPILEFDPNRRAIIEPTAWHRPIQGLAPAGLITWMADAFERFVAEHPSKVCYAFQAEAVEVKIHEVEFGPRRVVAALSSVGAPATAALYEVLIAIGCTTIVAVGSSGGLLAEHPPGAVVVPEAAIRDEGVSYHYAAPARLAHPDAGLQAELAAAYEAAGFEPIGGLAWTTDAFFRETSAKVQARIAEGAVAVDMEAAALATVAEFRGTNHGQVMYLADTLHGDAWDPTELVERDTEFRLRLLDVASDLIAV